MKAVNKTMKHIRKRRRTTDARMDGKLCVITGATSGIGLATARRLAEGGANLVLVARNRDKAEAVKAELETAHTVRADVVIADFARLFDVRAAAEAICGRYPAVDVLINCAGLFSTRHRVSEDGHELTFQVNHLSSFLLTMLLLKNLSKSPQGRIIQVNSLGHRFGGLNLNDLDWHKRTYLWPRAYGASKLAQLMTMHTFAALLKETNVTINAMYPGLVGSNIVQYSGKLLQFLMRKLKRILLRDPDTAGEALYYLAAAPELNSVSDRYFDLTTERKPASITANDALCARIWAESLALTGLQEASYGTIEKTKYNTV